MQTIHNQKIFSQGGSSYEDYDVASESYDTYRQAVGLEDIRNVITSISTTSNRQRTKLSLLDAGCGSGNYLNELKSDVGQLTGMEFNKKMITRAKKKLPTEISVLHGSILNLPFDDNSFDIILTTQVLHHLDGPDDIFRAAEEVFRCLSSGGVWIISTSCPNQYPDAFWWTPLIPHATRKVASRFPSIEKLKDIIREIGFVQGPVTRLPTTLMKSEKYLDLEGPFNEKYRNADSTWSQAGDEELAQGLKILRKKINTGEAEAWLDEREALRRGGGQTTIVHAFKK